MEGGPLMHIYSHSDFSGKIDFLKIKVLYTESVYQLSSTKTISILNINGLRYVAYL